MPKYLLEQCLDVSAAIVFLLRIYFLVSRELKRSDDHVSQYILSYDDFSKKISHESLYQNLEMMVHEFSSASSYYHSISSENIIEKVKKYVEENYWKSDLRLESIAAVFGYNSAYLGKLFSKETGVNFNSYLDTVRLERSIELIQNKKKIYQVAEECGFSNAEYFTKKFKKHFGMLPTEYQRKL